MPLLWHSSEASPPAVPLLHEGPRTLLRQQAFHARRLRRLPPTMNAMKELVAIRQEAESAMEAAAGYNLINNDLSTTMSHNLHAMFRSASRKIGREAAAARRFGGDCNPLAHSHVLPRGTPVAIVDGRAGATGGGGTEARGAAGYYQHLKVDINVSCLVPHTSLMICGAVRTTTWAKANSFRRTYALHLQPYALRLDHSLSFAPVHPRLPPLSHCNTCTAV